jgi:glycosyltransferase involved in cell wall biosynthesis
LQQIIELTKRLGIHHLSHFPGFVSPAGDLPGLYRLGSVFCTTSVIEIQSSVVLEAAATTLPVVAFRASSMPELVADGESGYLVPAVDTSALAGRLVELLQDHHLAQAMGRAGLRIAQRHAQCILSRPIRSYTVLYLACQRTRGWPRRRLQSTC